MSGDGGPLAATRGIKPGRLRIGTRVAITAPVSCFDGRTGVVREDRGGWLLPYGVKLEGRQTVTGGLIYCAADELQVQP